MAVLAAGPLAAQDLSAYDRERGLIMLRGVRRNLREFYYDSTFHGLDLDSLIRRAEARIRRAKSNSEVLAVIASVTIELDDSHTLFIPPPRVAHVDYGWEMAAVGDHVLVTGVRPGSAAASRGLRAGQRIVALNGIPMTRRAVWQARYAFEVVNPQPSLTVLVEDPSGSRAQLEVPAAVKQRGRYVGLERWIHDWETRDGAEKNREYVAAGGAFVWRMASFSQGLRERDILEDEDDLIKRMNREIDRMIGRARRHRALVLDLRGNSGGYVAVLARLASRLFTAPVLLGVWEGRDGVDTVWVEPRREGFEGPLVVLVDSESASAAEVLARLVQLEGRGTVMGDRTSGAVTASRVISEIAGVDRVAPYAVAVTVRAVRMGDGQRLERVGVIPDSLVLPTAEDVAAGRDPVLARAVAMLGGTLSATEAGRLFPREWR
jgi:carboxyl-terminal processing protease